VCYSAEKSIRSLLTTNNNAADLLAMHKRPSEATMMVEAEGANGRPVII
jgi:hypothetical protein